MPDTQNISPESSPLVLLIEDNAISRYTVARMLRQAGFAVAEAESGVKAKQIIGNSDVAVIVCDVALPDINGFELCRQLKSNPQTSAIPFLQMSASFTTPQDQIQGLEGGADGYLVQPFEIPVLAATIRSVLRVRVAEDEARTLSRQWQTTFTAIRDGIVVTDVQGRIIRCNEAFGALMGSSPEVLKNQSVFELGQLCLHFTSKSLSKTPPAPLEAQIGERWYRVQHDPILDERGVAVGLIQILSDNSAQKRAEVERENLIRSLEFERARFENIFKSVPASVAVMRGTEYRFELTNPAFEKFVGSRNPLGKTLKEVFPETESQGFHDLIERVYQSGEEFVAHEIPVLLECRPGQPLEERFIDLLYQPLIEPDGSISGVFSHTIDITEQVRARKEAENANRLKDEFLATLSHELRTPLMSIIGWTELLGTGKLDEETSKRALASIARNAQVQNQLVEDILDVSRIMSGKLTINTNDFDLVVCIEGAITVVRPAAAAKGIRLTIDIEPNVGLILGDANRLQQVMWNLLSNAIKFTPQGGRVTITLEQVGDEAQVTVADSGQGIAPEFLPHVFDRFRQADATSTRAHGGLGLGLAIVRQLVELHGGTIKAMSEGKGQGSLFIVRFPTIAATRPLVENSGSRETAAPQAESSAGEPSALDNDSKSAAPPVIPDAPVGELAGIRVLVVDDELDARVLVGIILQRVGAVVSLVGSVPEAWKQLQREPRPQLLISDIGMPGEDGYSLIRRVRQLEAETALAPLPAIALTAFARSEDHAQALKEGFDIYQSKPVEPTALIALATRLTKQLGKRL